MSPNSGDRMLAQNAQLYHFEHKKQQMLAFDGHADSQRRSMSDNESEDGEEGDYTVYECPGLAPVSYLKNFYLDFICNTQSLDFVFEILVSFVSIFIALKAERLFILHCRTF